MQPEGGAGAGWRGVAPFLAANVLFGAGLFAHAFLYNFYLEALGHGEAFMGLAAAAMTAGGLVALMPAGIALDRWGPRASYAAAAAVGFVGLAWGAFAEGRTAILAAAVLAGAGTATWRVTMGPVLMAIAPAPIRTRAFSWNVAGLLASGSAWTAAAGLLPGWWTETTGASELTGYRVGMVACALGTLVSAPLVAGLLRPAGGVRSDARAASDDGGAGGRDTLARAVRGLLVSARIRWLAGLVLLWMLGGGLTIPFFNLYFQRVHGLSVERIGVLFGLLQGVTAVVLVAGGELAQRVGKLRAFVGWVVAFPLALVGLALGGGVGAAVALYAVQGLAPPATNPLVDELLLDEADEPERGAVSSWRNGATELSGLVGAGAGGALLEVGSFGLLFAVAASVAALGGGLATYSLARGARARA